jgi:hypothetical protein
MHPIALVRIRMHALAYYRDIHTHTHTHTHTHVDNISVMMARDFSCHRAARGGSLAIFGPITVRVDAYQITLFQVQPNKRITDQWCNCIFKLESDTIATDEAFCDPLPVKHAYSKRNNEAKIHLLLI